MGAPLHCYVRMDGSGFQENWGITMFKHLGMMWMGICVHPYSRITCTGGGMAEPVPTSILDVYKVF